MTRLSYLASSVLAASLTILPAAAFAQQTAAPAPAAVPAAKAPASVTETKAPKTVNTDVKMPATEKTVSGVKPLHAGPGTAARAVPAKPAEPNKS
nr:hypothetical protein [uncultured Rhodopila sp.]